MFAGKPANQAVTRLVRLPILPPIKTVMACAVLAGLSAAQERVSFPTQDRGLIYGDVYGKGDRGLVLAHGGRFNKESWAKQARSLRKRRDFACWRSTSAATVSHEAPGSPTLIAPRSTWTYWPPSAICGRLALRRYRWSAAALAAAPPATRRLRPIPMRSIVWCCWARRRTARLKNSSRATLFIVARDDANDGGPRLPGIRAQYEKAPKPKRLIILDGSAHAQYLFQTDQGDRVMREILHFLSSRSPETETDRRENPPWRRISAQCHLLWPALSIPAQIVGQPGLAAPQLMPKPWWPQSKWHWARVPATNAALLRHSCKPDIIGQLEHTPWTFHPT